jgi:hypothetical protein
MLADGAQVLPWEAWEPQDWQADLRYLDAAGFQFTFDECIEQTSETGAAMVHCLYEAVGLGSDQIGMDPFGPHVFRVGVKDGQVVSSDMGFDFSRFSEAMWFPFQRWIQASHPEDFAVLYVESTLSRQTDEAIALWEERVAGYVEYVNDLS